jgi:MFS family permease
LTILSAGVPGTRRGAFIGAWSGIAGLAVALGPLVGGAVVSGISWHWIFWLNVPIGLALIPLARLRLQESHGPANTLDLPGLALASGGLFGIVWALVRGNAQGWSSTEIVTALSAGAIVLVAFIFWELRAESPMLPMRFFRNRAFALANAASLLMFFGMFGSIFLLSQFFQTVQGYSPLGSGLRILPWTVMPIFVAPVAGALSDGIGGHRLMGIGLTLQATGLASMAVLSTATVPYWELVMPFMVSGMGMAMFWAPVANVVLSAVRPEEEGQASGAQNAIRELGGVFGVAVLASVWAHYGSYASGPSYVDGMLPALWIGAAIVLTGAVASFAIGRRRVRADEVLADDLAFADAECRTRQRHHGAAVAAQQLRRVQPVVRLAEELDGPEAVVGAGRPAEAQIEALARQPALEQGADGVRFFDRPGHQHRELVAADSSEVVVGRDRRGERL